MTNNRLKRGRSSGTAALVVLAILSANLSSPVLRAQTAPARPPVVAWMNTKLSPDSRATLVLQQMTQDEKLQLVHGIGWGVLKTGAYVPPADNGGAGFVPGIPRLHIPDINLADSAVGVRMAAFRGRYATLLPSTLGAAASWDPRSAFLYGDVIGRELRAQGYNMSIGGGVDLTREPRNGRNFEYAGEDPLLAGTMTGNLMRGLQSNRIMGDIKHYALNDQETGRNIVNAVIDRKAMRESDLLAFQIAIQIADPSAVMCGYNKVNGDWDCENDYLLNRVLKHDFGFKGWVLSDWDGTHSTVKAALNGLDQEQPSGNFFGEPLRKAITAGQVPQARLDDMVQRILRSMFAAGVVDDPPVDAVVDPFQGRDDAQHIEEESIVLLKNAANVLPLSPQIHSIALIGSHADVGVLSGGGSAQVDAPGGNVADPKRGGSEWGHAVYFPSSPMKEIQKKAPHAKLTYNDGQDIAAAVAQAKSADVAIVFVNQYMSEGRDAPTLALPDGQDALVAAVAAANPHTLVVLETGGPVTLPWHNEVAGILAAWYPGIGGAQAMASVLFGDVNPSGKLPITFAARDEDLPHPRIPGLVYGGGPNGAKIGTADGASDVTKPFDADYTEGARVGYKWFESEHKQPLFAFGFGLSYSTFAYLGLSVDAAAHTATFTVRNTGKRSGEEIAQVYVELPSAAGEHFKRLAGWQRLSLATGESRSLTVQLDPRTLAVFDTAKDALDILPGAYKVLAGPSSSDTPLTAVMVLK
jgi:beta-glucosidase